MRRALVERRRGRRWAVVGSVLTSMALYRHGIDGTLTEISCQLQEQSVTS
jgi:hypothetical protein